MQNTQYYPNRQSIRIKGFDYGSVGTYFITICCHNRESLFGLIEKKQMVLNQHGVIVTNAWRELAVCNQHIRLDEFIVMPDHFHGLIHIKNCEKSKSIGRLVAAFKTVVCKSIRTQLQNPDIQIWQRNYWERIIRSGLELTYVQQYIRNNPQQHL